ncbi:hypothetical protein KSP39_PZI016099 [Platanthera zijinensis]|uniref:Uncharacterized protein n=1 Tax=Platanthera zijinensis TaxID=2320716 RepID=A0AAP0B714_9ASPA
MRQWKGGGGIIAVLLCVLVMVADGHGEEGNLFHDEQGRILRDDGNISESVLTRTTERVDPLEHFKKYNGGFNITNKNYWSSTIFTGKFGYIIAVAWLISGLIYSTVLIFSYISFYIEGRNENERAICFKSYNWSLLIAALFTFLAIVASVVALKGSTGFHSRAVAIENLAVEATNNASGTINTVTESVEILQNDTQLSKNINGSSTLRLTTKKLNDEASNIQMKAERIMHKVTNGSNILNAVTIITVALNLLVIILLLASVPFRLRQIFCPLVILCWLLTVLLWAYFGLYYFFANFAGDTCIALDEYWRNPGIAP